MAYCLSRLVGEVELHNFQRRRQKASYRRSSVALQPHPTGESPVTTAKPRTRYGAN
jgi:hypothetical protein